MKTQIVKINGQTVMTSATHAQAESMIAVAIVALGWEAAIARAAMETDNARGRQIDAVTDAEADITDGIDAALAQL